MTDLYAVAQDFRIRLYREIHYCLQAEIAPIEIWKTLQQMQYDGPNRESILVEMKEKYLK